MKKNLESPLKYAKFFVLDSITTLAALSANENF